jgi:hypothetical protein
MTRNIAKVAVVLVAAAAVALSAAASARADADVSVSFDGHRRALATFIAYGDEFRICDTQRDNLPVAVRYSYVRKNGNTQRGTHWHVQGVDGVGTPQKSTGYRQEGCSFFDHDFAEHRRVWVQACVRQPEEGTLSCGSTQVTRTS